MKRALWILAVLLSHWRRHRMQLATLLIAESDGRLTSESLLLGRAVSGLRAVGLDSDAHALALEAALDAGI